jgi:hypothetical protein
MRPGVGAPSRPWTLVGRTIRRDSVATEIVASNPLRAASWICSRCGPFLLWKHAHGLAPIESGTEIYDHVRYRPFSACRRARAPACARALRERPARRLVEWGEVERQQFPDPLFACDRRIA